MFAYWRYQAFPVTFEFLNISHGRQYKFWLYVCIILSTKCSLGLGDLGLWSEISVLNLNREPQHLEPTQPPANFTLIQVRQCDYILRKLQNSNQICVHNWNIIIYHFWTIVSWFLCDWCSVCCLMFLLSFKFCIKWNIFENKPWGSLCEYTQF